MLDNSLRYSEAPAQIQLQVQSTAVGVELRWQDQGLGITAEPRDPQKETVWRSDDKEEMEDTYLRKNSCD